MNPNTMESRSPSGMAASALRRYLDDPDERELEGLIEESITTLDAAAKEHVLLEMMADSIVESFPHFNSGPDYWVAAKRIVERREQRSSLKLFYVPTITNVDNRMHFVRVMAATAALAEEKVMEEIHDCRVAVAMTREDLMNTYFSAVDGTGQTFVADAVQEVDEP